MLTLLKGGSVSGYSSYRNNLQGKIDWGHLATHLTAVASKKIVEAYYGKAPVYSYHLGGSTGGRQGLGKLILLTLKHFANSLQLRPKGIQESLMEL